jgi:alkylation response protein AidB-like acyl-CoA dehydrogenase
MTSGLQQPEIDLVARTGAFLEEHVYSAEPALSSGGAEAQATLRDLQSRAKDAGLWALGHPTELGGSGLGLVPFLTVQEEQGRSEYGNFVFGSATRQDVLSLAAHGSDEVKERFLDALVTDGVTPSLAMTEPGVSGSDPLSLRTHARLDGNEWVINGLKSFVTGAENSPYYTVMCRTEPGVADRDAFTLILVPQGTRGVRLIRETPLLGLARGHWEVEFDDVRVPGDYAIGEPGRAFAIAQERLTVGRLLHAARWIGLARRAFDLMCVRLNERSAGGASLAKKQLMQQHVFECHAEILTTHLLAVEAARKIEVGDDARLEVGTLKVIGSRMQQIVVDRAVQVFGADGLTDDFALSAMYRVARFGRIYDGPDEVHIESVAKRLLRAYSK